jgi:hypothetical protein
VKDENLLQLMLAIDPQTRRIPPGVRVIADAVEATERERYAPMMQAVEWLLDDGHMNQEHLARIRATWEQALLGQVEPTVKRPLSMPEYTLEQKAKAFDSLWETCGLCRGMLKDYVDRPVSRAAREATFLRVPRYTFEILAEGEGMQRFRDVLHHLATREEER